MESLKSDEMPDDELKSMLKRSRSLSSVDLPKKYKLRMTDEVYLRGTTPKPLPKDIKDFFAPKNDNQKKNSIAYEPYDEEAVKKVRQQILKMNTHAWDHEPGEEKKHDAGEVPGVDPDIPLTQVVVEDNKKEELGVDRDIPMELIKKEPIKKELVQEIKTDNKFIPPPVKYYVGKRAKRPLKEVKAQKKPIPPPFTYNEASFFKEHDTEINIFKVKLNRRSERIKEAREAERKFKEAEEIKEAKKAQLKKKKEDSECIIS